MNRINRLLSITAIALASTAIPAGINAETGVIAVSDFSGINVSDNIEVVLKSDQNPSARIEADDISGVAFEQRDQMINISLRGNARTGRHDKKVKVYLTAPVVTTYMADKGAEIEIVGEMDTERRDVTVDLKSGAEVEFDNLTCNTLKVSAAQGSEADFTRLQTNNADLKASAGSEIEVSGRTSSARFSAIGGSKIKAANLSANEANAVAASGSLIRCNVDGKFSQTTDNSSTVRNITGN